MSSGISNYLSINVTDCEKVLTLTKTVINSLCMSGNGQVFHWHEKATAAALGLAEGKTIQQIASEIEISERQIYRWKNDIEFSAEVDRLSLMIGVASRAERLRLAQRVIRQKVKEDGSIATDKDLLEWLKFAQSETDGIKLDLRKVAAAFGEDEASVADSGSTTGDSGTEGATTEAVN